MIRWGAREEIGGCRTTPSPRLRHVALFLLVLGLLAGALMLEPGAALAQGSEVQRGPEVMQGGGREISARDWLNHLPLALGVVLFVVAVDAFVIFKFVLGRRESW